MDGCVLMYGDGMGESFAGIEGILKMDQSGKKQRRNIQQQQEYRYSSSNDGEEEKKVAKVHKFNKLCKLAKRL